LTFFKTAKDFDKALNFWILDKAKHHLGQGFSTFFCSWPTKLVRNGVGP